MLQTDMVEWLQLPIHFTLLPLTSKIFYYKAACIPKWSKSIGDESSSPCPLLLQTKKKCLWPLSNYYTINSKIQQPIPFHGKITRQEERTTTCTQLCLVESILTSIIYLSPLHISNRWIPVFSHSTVIRRRSRRPRKGDKNCIGVG